MAGGEVMVIAGEDTAARLEAILSDLDVKVVRIDLQDRGDHRWAASLP